MNKRHVLIAVAAVVLIALVPSLPYGYYSVMRWVVCALCVWLALVAHKSAQEGWTWTWVIVAGVYNPIVPVHANRELWSVVNVATAALCLAFQKSSQPNRENNK